MAEVNLPEMNAVAQTCVKQVIGQSCSRCHIGRDRSLFLGFGKVVRIKSITGEADHGEWEIGTYRSAWRIGRAQQIICGSQDIEAPSDELVKTVNQVKSGKCTAIRQLSNFDVRVEFDNDIFVDFLGTFSDEDEVVHIFCPQEIVVTFSIPHGWAGGPADEPWKAGPQTAPKL